MAAADFLARIAWSSERFSPTWECQTEHRGFTNWMAPVLFAHGLTVPAPRLLVVSGSQPHLELNTGERLEIGRQRLASPGLSDIELTVWQLMLQEPEQSMASCDAYRQVPLTVARPLSALSLDGEWMPTSYDVRGPDGSVPLLIECDDTGAVLRIALGSDEVRLSRQQVGAVTYGKP